MHHFSIVYKPLSCPLKCIPQIPAAANLCLHLALSQEPAIVAGHEREHDGGSESTGGDADGENDDSEDNLRRMAWRGGLRDSGDPLIRVAIMKREREIKLMPIMMMEIAKKKTIMAPREEKIPENKTLLQERKKLRRGAGKTTSTLMQRSRDNAEPRKNANRSIKENGAPSRMPESLVAP